MTKCNERRVVDMPDVDIEWSENFGGGGRFVLWNLDAL